MKPDLRKLRRQIDCIDTELVRLLNRRAACARVIGKIKRRHGAPVRDRVREREVYARMRRLARRPLTPMAAEWIYRRIVNTCARLEG